MKNKRHLFGIPLLVMIALLAGACIRPPSDAATPAGVTTATTGTPVAGTTTPTDTRTMTATVTATTTSGAAKATVNIKSLRVRAQPDNTSTVVTGIKQGETYNVIGLSSDGSWVQLEIPQATGGSGWVSANFVTVQGSITDTPITQVSGTGAMTATATTTETGTMTATGTMTETPVATKTSTMTETATSTETSAMTATSTVTETGAMTKTPAATDTTTVTETPTTTETGAMTGTMSMTDTTAMTGTNGMTGTTGMTTTVAPAPGMAVVTTSGARLRVRSKPNADAQIVGYAYNGESYKVLGASEDKRWVQIAGSTAGKGENPTGGWVAAEFLVIGQ